MRAAEATEAGRGACTLAGVRRDSTGFTNLFAEFAVALAVAHTRARVDMADSSAVASTRTASRIARFRARRTVPAVVALCTQIAVCFEAAGSADAFEAVRRQSALGGTILRPVASDTGRATGICAVASRTEEAWRARTLARLCRSSSNARLGNTSVDTDRPRQVLYSWCMRAGRDTAVPTERMPSLKGSTNKTQFSFLTKASYGIRFVDKCAHAIRRRKSIGSYQIQK